MSLTTVPTSGGAGDAGHAGSLAHTPRGALDGGYLPLAGDRSRATHVCSDEKAVTAIGVPTHAVTW